MEERIIKSTLALLVLLAAFGVLALAAPAMAQTSAQSTAAGRNLAAACASCHGTNGAATDGMPALAGKPRPYLSQSLKDFRDGRRPGTLMPQLAKGYTDTQIEALATYLAAQQEAP